MNQQAGWTLIAFLVLAACSRETENPPFQNLNAAYVGIDACGGCHPDKVATFTESQMGRSWELATPANSSANFDNPGPVYDAHNDLYYQALRRGEVLYIMEYRLRGTDTTHKRVEKIDYIVGSGHHTNSHIMNVNGYLYQMPLTWYVQDGKWDLPPGFVGPSNMRFDRPIPLKCITCHNAMPEYVDGSENKYESVPHGIDCERCHGPGSLHIETVRAGGAVNTAVDTDYTIVNPAKLSLDRQFDICQGCHLQGASVPVEGRTFADFRPSQSLVDIENVFWPRYADSVRQFVMASHPDRLKQSACFQASENLTCITCHDPHVRIEAMGENHYRDVCQDCHTGGESLTCPTPDGISGANCTTCHMPISGSEDIPHITITDHFIRSPGAEAPVLTEPGSRAQFVRLASLVKESPSLGETAEGYLTYYETVTNHPGFLDSALVYLERAQAQDESVEALLVRTHFLRGDFISVMGLAGRMETMPDAWTAYRIGETFLSQGMASEARRFLEEAVRMAPAHLRFMSRLAAAYGQEGRNEEAVALLDRVLAANPKLSEAYNNRGFAHVMLANAEQAEADFLAAVALDPDMDRALANLASLYLNTGRKAMARPYAQRVLELEGANMQYRRLWELVQ